MTGRARKVPRDQADRGGGSVVLHWQGAATTHAAVDLTARAALLADAAAAVASTGETGEAVAGHEHVSTGLAEFAAYWTPFLGSVSHAAELLATHVTAAGEAFAATDTGAGVLTGPR